MKSGENALTFVLAVNDPDIFESNFMASPCFREPNNHEILVQKNFPSAAVAYNDALRRSANDLVVFAHQDILLPASWTSDLQRALTQLDTKDPDWGVLGCFGATGGGSPRGYVYSQGQGVMGDRFESPQPVQTLDEIVLILRKSSNIVFDEKIPHYHMYGADICLSAAKSGRKSYAISAFCIHNTQQNLVLPHEFYECYRVLKAKWKKSLPIHTTCIAVTRFDLPMYTKRLKEARLHFILHKDIGAMRAKDGRQLLALFDRSSVHLSHSR
jgi:hypothetical protein